MCLILVYMCHKLVYLCVILVAAYESMMDALSEPNSSYEVDLPMKKLLEDGSETTWYY